MSILSVSSLLLPIVLLSLSSLFLPFLLLTDLIDLAVDFVDFIVILDLELSVLFLDRQKLSPVSTLSPASEAHSDDEEDHLDSSRNVLEARYGLGVPIAMTLRDRITLSRALSTPESVPPALIFRGEAEEGVVCMMEDLRRRTSVLDGERYCGDEPVDVLPSTR